MNKTAMSSINGSSHVGLVRALHNDVAVVTGTLGVLFNALSLAIFIRKRQLLADIPRRIILNKCSVDLTSGVFLIYSQFHSMYLGVDLPRDLPDPRAYCHIVWSTYLLWSLLNVSSWNIQLLTVERYLSVCHPVAHKNRCTTRFLLAILIALWIVGFLWTGIFATSMSYLPDTNQCIYAPLNPTLMSVFGSSFLVHSFCIPVLLMLFGYGRMLVVLKKNISSPGGIMANEARKTRSFILVCAIILLAYVVCYSFNAAYYFLATIELIHLQPESTFYHFTVLMVFVNCFINPIIFAVRMPGYRRELKAMMKCGNASATHPIPNY